MSINECPVELLEMIAEWISCETTLRNLRAVDKTFCTLATARAFRTAYMTDQLESVVGLKTLMESEGLAKCVERIVFRWSEGSLVPRVDWETRKMMRATSLATVFSQLHNFPALTALDLNFFPGLWTDQIEPTENLVLQSVVLQALTRNTCLPPIRTLTLGNIVPFPFAFYESAEFATLLGSLEHLRMTVHGLNNMGTAGNAHELWEWMWQEMIPVRLLAPPQRQLTSLVLTSDQPVGLVPHVDFSGLFYPALRHLELGGVAFSRSRRVEDFVARHRATLTSLVLDSCPMHVDDRQAGPGRTWGAVCERFGEELDHLVELRVLLRADWGLNKTTRSEEARLTYESSLTGFGYQRGWLCSEFEAADAPALDMLFATVRARKEKRGKNTSPPSAAVVAQEPSERFVVPIV